MPRTVCTILYECMERVVRQHRRVKCNSILIDDPLTVAHDAGQKLLLNHAICALFQSQSFSTVDEYERHILSNQKSLPDFWTGINFTGQNNDVRFYNEMKILTINCVISNSV